MINYKNIHDSIEFYSSKGFLRVEAPWTVTPYISSITKPKDKIDFKIEHNQKVLVASGEQSFLYNYLKGFLPPGKFQTVTPCFRDEIFDLTHTKYFIKNELIVTDQVDHEMLNFVISSSKEFFSSMFKNPEMISVIKTSEDSYDLEYNGIELGSYGIRSTSFVKWIYGTGCAEPRLSNIQQIYL